MPASIGSYSPKNKSSVEELSPGTIKLKPQSTPHKTKPQKSAPTVMFHVERKSHKSTIIAANPMIAAIELPFLPFSPASRQSSGNVPIIKPMNAQVTRLVFFSSSTAAIPDSPTKPAPTPAKKVKSISPYFLSPAFT